MVRLIVQTFPATPLTSVQLTLGLRSGEGHGEDGHEDEEELEKKQQRLKLD